MTWFIVNELDTYPSSVVTRTAKRFGISSQAVRYRMQDLVHQGVITASGRTRARKYELKLNAVLREEIDVDANLEEHIIFERTVRPKLGDVPDSVLRICRYGFTEMVNNVIDHSQSAKMLLHVYRNPVLIGFSVIDYGIGIFKKIRDALGLADERQSLLELSKGKLTTDPSKHTGEGIFFTSRAFDNFSITSGQLYFWHKINHDDWLIESTSSDVAGTLINMQISTYSKTVLKDIFERYTTADREDSFARTHVPISLAQYGDGDLVSRSQAKRVLSRFEQFQEVLLDFDGVETVGQAFTDEIFRVFRHTHPNVDVCAVRANAEVARLIQRATKAYEDDVAHGRFTDLMGI